MEEANVESAAATMQNSLFKVSVLMDRVNSIRRKANTKKEPNIEAEKAAIEEEIKENEELRDKISGQRQRRAESDSIQDEVNEVTERLNSLKAIQAELSSYKSELDIVKEELGSRKLFAEEEIDACEAELPPLLDEISKIETERANINADMAVATEELVRKEKLLKEAEENMLRIMSAGGFSNFGFFKRHQQKTQDREKKMWSFEGGIADGDSPGHEKGEDYGLSAAERKERAEHYWTIAVRAIRHGLLPGTSAYAQLHAGRHRSVGGVGSSQEGSLSPGGGQGTSSHDSTNIEDAGALSKFEQLHMLNDQANTIKSLTKKLTYKQQRFLDGEKSLSAMKERYDYLRIELTALRRALADFGGDTVEDLKAEIRFYKKERLSLYQRIYYRRSFTMPPVKRIYVGDDGEEIEGESAVELLKKKAKADFERNMAQADGRGYQMRVVERQKTQINQLKDMLQHANMYIDRLHRKVEVLEGDALVGHDTYLAGTADKDAEIDRFVSETQKAHERMLLKQMDERKEFEKEKKRFAQKIEDLKGDIATSNAAQQKAEEDLFLAQKDVQMLKDEMAGLQRQYNVAAASMVPEDLQDIDKLLDALRKEDTNTYLQAEQDSTISRIASEAQRPVSEFIESLYSGQHELLLGITGTLRGLFKDSVRKNGNSSTALMTVHEKLIGLFSLSKKIGRRVCACAATVVHDLEAKHIRPECFTATTQTVIAKDSRGGGGHRRDSSYDDFRNEEDVANSSKRSQTDLSLIGVEYTVAITQTPHILMREATTLTDSYGAIPEKSAGNTASNLQQRRLEDALRGQLALAKEEVESARSIKASAKLERQIQFEKRCEVELLYMDAEERISYANEVLIDRKNRFENREDKATDPKPPFGLDQETQVNIKIGTGNVPSGNFNRSDSLESTGSKLSRKGSMGHQQPQHSQDSNALNRSSSLSKQQKGSSGTLAKKGSVAMGKREDPKKSTKNANASEAKTSPPIEGVEPASSAEPTPRDIPASKLANQTPSDLGGQPQQQEKLTTPVSDMMSESGAVKSEDGSQPQEEASLGRHGSVTSPKIVKANKSKAGSPKASAGETSSSEQPKPKKHVFPQLRELGDDEGRGETDDSPSGANAGPPPSSLGGRQSSSSSSASTVVANKSGGGRDGAASQETGDKDAVTRTEAIKKVPSESRSPRYTHEVGLQVCISVPVKRNLSGMTTTDTSCDAADFEEELSTAGSQKEVPPQQQRGSPTSAAKQENIRNNSSPKIKSICVDSSTDTSGLFWTPPISQPPPLTKEGSTVEEGTSPLSNTFARKGSSPKSTPVSQASAASPVGAKESAPMSSVVAEATRGTVDEAFSPSKENRPKLVDRASSARPLPTLQSRATSASRLQRKESALSGSGPVAPLTPTATLIEKTSSGAQGSLSKGKGKEMATLTEEHVAQHTSATTEDVDTTASTTTIYQAARNVEMRSVSTQIAFVPAAGRGGESDTTSLLDSSRRPPDDSGDGNAQKHISGRRESTSSSVVAASSRRRRSLSDRRGSDIVRKQAIEKGSEVPVKSSSVKSSPTDPEMQVGIAGGGTSTDQQSENSVNKSGMDAVGVKADELLKEKEGSPLTPSGGAKESKKKSAVDDGSLGSFSNTDADVEELATSVSSEVSRRAVMEKAEKLAAGEELDKEEIIEQFERQKELYVSEFKLRESKLCRERDSLKEALQRANTEAKDAVSLRHEVADLKRTNEEMQEDLDMTGSKLTSLTEQLEEVRRINEELVEKSKDSASSWKEGTHYVRTVQREQAALADMTSRNRLMQREMDTLRRDLERAKADIRTLESRLRNDIEKDEITQIQRDREQVESVLHATKISGELQKSRAAIQTYKVEINRTKELVEAKEKEVQHVKGSTDRKLQNYQNIIQGLLREKEQLQVKIDGLRGEKVDESKQMMTALDREKEDKRSEMVRAGKDLAAERRRMQELMSKQNEMQREAQRIIDQQQSLEKREQDLERRATGHMEILKEKETLAQTRVLRVHKIVMETTSYIKQAFSLPCAISEPVDVHVAKNYLEGADAFSRNEPERATKVNQVILDIAASDMIMLKRIMDALKDWTARKMKKNEESEEATQESKLAAAGRRRWDTLGASVEDPRKARTPMQRSATPPQSAAAALHVVDFNYHDLPALNIDGEGLLGTPRKVHHNESEDATRGGSPSRDVAGSTLQVPQRARVMVRESPPRRPSPSAREVAEKMKQDAETRRQNTNSPTRFEEFIHGKGETRAESPLGNRGKHLDELVSILERIPERPATTIPNVRAVGPRDMVVGPRISTKLRAIQRTITESLPRRVGTPQGPLAGRFRQMVHARGIPLNPGSAAAGAAGGPVGSGNGGAAPPTSNAVVGGGKESRNVVHHSSMRGESR